MFDNFFFRKSCLNGVIWKNIAEQCMPQMTIWSMRIACWTPKATNARTICVILIAFPLQQRLHERVSELRYMYIAACLVGFSMSI
jgi:hypothetical protein